MSWPKYNHDLKNTGLSTYKVVDPPVQKLWEFTTGGAINQPPVIGPDGTIYFGSSDGYLYAVYPISGVQKWRFQLGTDSPAAVIGADGTIYTRNQSTIYALNPSGTVKWFFDNVGYVMLDTIPMTITADETYLLIPVYDSGLEVGNVWRLDIVSDPKAISIIYHWYDKVFTPAIGSDGTVYITSDEHELAALNPDGSAKWEFPVPYYTTNSPAIGQDGAIHFGAGTVLYAINQDGTKKWELNLYVGLQSPSIGPDGTIYIASSRYLHAISPDGTQKWEYYLSWSWRNLSIDSDGVVYTIRGESGIAVEAIYPQGTSKWSLTLNAAMSYAPVIASNGFLYVGSANGKLYAMGPPSFIVLNCNPSSGTPIGTEQSLELSFSESIDANTVNLSSVQLNSSFKWTYDDIEKKLTLLGATGEWTANSHLTLSLTSALKDIYGRPLANPTSYEWDVIGSSPATYYVRTDGDDANNGLGPEQENAFQTISHAINIAVANGANGIKIYIAPGTYSEYIQPSGYPHYNNLIVEGDTSGKLFDLSSGSVIANYIYCNHGGGQDSVVTYKNIIVINSVYSSDDNGENCSLTLINIVTKNGGFYLNSDTTYVLAVNCTSWNGFFTGDGDFYNCITPYGFYPGLARIYNCMAPNVYPSSGSIVEEHIYESPQFIDRASNDFRLVEGSPGRDSGVEVENYSPDIYGGLRISTPDRGAAEVVAPLVSDPPIILGPMPIRCAKPMVVLQAPVPVGNWLLHFKIESFSDAEGTIPIAVVDSSINPELFEYSTDGGLIWTAFPETGLPQDKYGALVRARCEVGPRQQVWLKASVGAEDA